MLAQLPKPSLLSPPGQHRQAPCQGKHNTDHYGQGDLAGFDSAASSGQIIADAAATAESSP